MHAGKHLVCMDSPPQLFFLLTCLVHGAKTDVNYSEGDLNKVPAPAFMYLSLFTFLAEL